MISVTRFIPPATKSDFLLYAYHNHKTPNFTSVGATSDVSTAVFRPRFFEGACSSKSSLATHHQVIKSLEKNRALSKAWERLSLLSHLRRKNDSLLPNLRKFLKPGANHLSSSHHNQWSWTVFSPQNKSPFSQNQQSYETLLLVILVAYFFFTQNEASAEEHQVGPTPLILTETELHHLAEALNISTKGSYSAIIKECFERLVKDCIYGNWTKIKENKDLVARITDASGKTLFLRMVEEGRNRANPTILLIRRQI